MLKPESPLKRGSLLQKHRFAWLFFVYLVLYHVVIVNHLKVWSLNETTYSQYCVDYSFGFASKLLPGAIYRFLLRSHASRLTATIYATVVIVIIFFGLSVLLEKFMQQIPIKYQGAAVSLVLFFLSGAYTFSIYTKWLGILDTYWLLILLLFFAFLEHKRLRFLIPALYVFSLLIHFSALVFFITVFSIVLLYRISVSSEERDRVELGVVFALSLIVTAAVFFWLILNESNTVCSMEEFHSKLQTNGTDYFFYHNYAFFKIWGEDSFVPDFVNQMKPSFTKFFYLFYYQVKLCYKLLFSNLTKSIVSTFGGTMLLCPVVCLFLRFHWSHLRQRKNAFSRFCSFLMLIQFPFVYVLGLLFAVSVDMTRYLCHGFLGLFVCVLTVLYYEEEMRTQFFEKIKNYADSLPVKIYAFAFMTVILSPSL